jgi:hypothetical protein
VLRIGQKLASFKVPNVNRPIMFCGVIFFEHGLLSIGKNARWLFILTNSFSVDWGIKYRLGLKWASFELPHINTLLVLYGMTLFEHM